MFRPICEEEIREEKFGNILWNDSTISCGVLFMKQSMASSESSWTLPSMLVMAHIVYEVRIGRNARILVAEIWKNPNMSNVTRVV